MKTEAPITLNQRTVRALLYGQLDELVLPRSARILVGQHLWVRETHREVRHGKKQGHFVYRVDPLFCGHPRASSYILRYRCTNAPVCTDVHASACCALCFDAGLKDEGPVDFQHELRRRRARDAGWTPARLMPQRAARFYLDAWSVEPTVARKQLDDPRTENGIILPGAPVVRVLVQAVKRPASPRPPPAMPRRRLRAVLDEDTGPFLRLAGPRYRPVDALP